MVGKKYFLVTGCVESESACIPSIEPTDNAEPGPTAESNLEPTSDTEPVDESTFESEPTFELKPEIDSCHYSGRTTDEGCQRWDCHSFWCDNWR